MAPKLKKIIRGQKWWVFQIKNSQENYKKTQEIHQKMIQWFGLKTENFMIGLIYFQIQNLTKKIKGNCGKFLMV